MRCEVLITINNKITVFVVSCHMIITSVQPSICMRCEVVITLTNKIMVFSHQSSMPMHCTVVIPTADKKNLYFTQLFKMPKYNLEVLLSSSNND
jgi:hypothetical protein